MAFSKQERASPSDPLTPGSGRRHSLGILRGGLLLVVAFLTVSWLLPGIPSTAERTKDAEEPDFPELFRAVAAVLKHAYLDLDRSHPRALMEKAFAALENAVDEVYVENSEDLKPYVAVHVESKVQVFNLEAVDSIDSAVTMLENVFLFLKRSYRGDKELNEIRYAAINGFLSGLDPHTMVFSPTAFKDFSVHIEGEIYGVGMYVGSRDGKLMVIEVLKETPARLAGFKKGDIISKIGDESTINMTVPEAVEKIRGPLKSWVTLAVKRAKADDPEKLETLEIPVQRDRVVIKSVESKLIRDWDGSPGGEWSGSVGYVKVVNFDKNTTLSLRQHLRSLEEQNDGKPLASLILDLRGNSGGLLTQAVEMSDLFLESGTIVVTATRGNRFYYQEAEDDGAEPDCPMVVLASESSASGAEIVIGALQKNNRALVLGTRTFGKGSVQQLHRLPNGAQLKITVSEYLLPGKISIQENGVVPDIHGKPVVLGPSGFDLFPNERSMTEKDYDQHIVSKFAQREVPSYTLDYYYEPPDLDLYSDPFMSGDLEPEKDKLVETALGILSFAKKPFDPSAVLQTGEKEFTKLKHALFEEIVTKLGEKGVDWTFAGGAPETIPAGALDLRLSARFTEEPSGDPEDPVPVNHLVVKARLENKGEKTLYRVKALSRSDYFLYKDQEFLFGKLEPGEASEREVQIRLPYFPTARNDLFVVEVSSTREAPGWEEPDDVLLSESIPIPREDRGRPSFAYSAELLDSSDPDRRETIRSLEPGIEAVLKVRIRNTGDAPVHKGIAILRNETEPRRQIFLRKGRIEFPASPPEPDGTTAAVSPGAVPPGDGSPGDRSEGDGSEVPEARPEGSATLAAAAPEPLPVLEPGGVAEVEFAFEVRSGEPVELYEFELAIVDSYSSAALLQRLSIPTRAKELSKPFPNDVEFAPPQISAILSPSTPEAKDGSVLVTEGERLELSARIKTPDGATFKAWIFNSLVGDHELPDKIYFIDSKGEAGLDVERTVPLKKGTNFFTVVARDRNDLETRQSIFVRRQ